MNTSATNQWSKARRIAAEHYGEEAIDGKIIHHIDGNPWNNDLSNLKIVDNHKEHKRLHAEMGKNGIVNKRDGVTMIFYNIPPELRKKMKMLCVDEGVSVNAKVIELIRQYVTATDTASPNSPGC